MIQVRTLKFFVVNKKDPGTGELISINLLEYATIIINFAAATLSIITRPTLLSKGNPFPALLNWADNMSANSWTRKSCTASYAGRCLSRLLCSLCLNNPLGLNADFIAGIDNIVADMISRLHPVPGTGPNFSALFQAFPSLTACRRFHPSPELLSRLMQALLSEAAPVIPPPKTLGHFTQGNSII